MVVAFFFGGGGSKKSEGGISIFRLFSRKKGGNKAENNFPPLFPEKGWKVDFPPGRRAEGGGRFLPEAQICSN